MNFKKLFCTLTVATLTVAVAFAQSQYVFTTKSSVNLRKAASTASAKAGTLTKGEMLPLVEETDGWYKVDVNGAPAFVSQSVASVCDANVPAEMFGKTLGSSEPWDKIRFEGSITITPVGKDHAVINMEWMRVNLPAESWNYMATVKDGKVVATHNLGMSWIDPDQPYETLMEEAEPLAIPLPVGFDEFNNTLYFNGAVFSEFE